MAYASVRHFAWLALLVAGCGTGGGGGASPGSDGGGATDASVPTEASAGHDASIVDASAGDGNDGGVTPGVDTNVSVFTQAPVFFGPTVNQRTIDQTATFPTTGAYQTITLHLSLTCPAMGCDVWDRFGTLAVVQPVAAGDGGTTERLLEVARFVTPYGLPAANDPQPTWDIDVTELRPLLSGSVTLRAFIDTWVPQNVTNEGYGWLVTATFEMKGGVPAKLPVAVVPLWSWLTTNKEPTQVVYGDPAIPIAQSLPPQTVALPAGATSFGVRSFVTGHGQGNLDNCAEFCSRQHTWTVGNAAPNTKTIWRTDCQNFPSAGTYQYPRAGWCPGVNVDAWDLDVTSQVGAGGSATFAYGVDDYLNTCNAGADGGGPCTGCQTGESCAYNGADHTQPFYYVSALLIGFR